MPKLSLFAGLSHRKMLVKAMARQGSRVVKNRAGPIIERAQASDPAGTGSLADIEHLVLLMQENHSFDNYFGTLSGVRGFDDPPPAFRQFGYSPGAGVTPSGYLNPFRLDTTRGVTLDGDAINDPTHEWGPQHRAWHEGAMDQWVTTPNVYSWRTYPEELEQAG